ncbi:hypothetical protein BC829DRAFT_380608 [Chytridium lagenaria]|nr:hypothetical protein BC829DRAFT_380608 [Chytridium lagenaria]
MFQYVGMWLAYARNRNMPNRSDIASEPTKGRSKHEEAAALSDHVPALERTKSSDVQKAIKGLSRLEELIKRSSDINIHHPNNIDLTLNDFCRALALMHSSKLRNYSLPLLLDEVWQLAILDMEYYGYVCWYSVYFYGGYDFASNEIALTCPLHISYDPLAFEFESFEEGQTALALAFQEKYGRRCNAQ